MEGPAFSTKAESNLYRSWGMDVIGMTNMPEAKLAREAEISYATLAMATWAVAIDTHAALKDNIVAYWPLDEVVGTKTLRVRDQVAGLPRGRTLALLHARPARRSRRSNCAPASRSARA